MPQREMFGNLPPLSRQIDFPAALHSNVAVARHALQCRGNRRRRNIQLFRQPRADGRLVLFQHLPNRFEVIFLRYAGLFASQSLFLSKLSTRSVGFAPAIFPTGLTLSSLSLRRFSD